MAIAVLHSNDHAGDVVRVIRGSYAAKPAYLWEPGEKHTLVHFTSDPVGTPSKAPKFPATR